MSFECRDNDSFDSSKDAVGNTVVFSNFKWIVRLHIVFIVWPSILKELSIHTLIFQKSGLYSWSHHEVQSTVI